jgi:hypothetical protein
MTGFITAFFSVTLNYNQLQQLTNNDCLRLAPFLTWLLMSSLLRDLLGSDLRIGHFFRFRCLLVNTPQPNTRLNRTTEFSYKWRLTTESRVESSLILRPTVSRPVSLEIKHISGAYDQIFITVRQLQVSWFGALSLTRGRVWLLQLLLALASAVIFGSESRGTRDYILLSQVREFPFLRLLRLAGLRWRYSKPTSTESRFILPPFITSGRTECKSQSPIIPLLFCVYPLLRNRVEIS